MGSVLRSTSILPAVKRKYPSSHITWVTQKAAAALLQENPFVDRVLSTELDDVLALSTLSFDIALNLDKSLKSVGILRKTDFDILYGFTADANGAIVPATAAAEELWHIGLDDERKFFINQKAETQLLVEALELGSFARDGYVLRLNAEEKRQSTERKMQWAPGGEMIVGINTGCSGVLPHKMLSIGNHRALLQLLREIPDIRLVLLGGGETDAIRNQRIGYGLPVVQSNCQGGLRDGLVSVAACDVVISGDSLGMHMAIALRKWVVAWFGPTCAQEIDLYDWGVKVASHASCSPCWKRHCTKNPMCYDLVDLRQIVDGVRKGLDSMRTSLPPPAASITMSR